MTTDKELEAEIKRLENRPYLDLTLICAKLNLNKNDIRLIENTFNLECLDNRLQGRQEARKEVFEEVEKMIDKIINKDCRTATNNSKWNKDEKAVSNVTLNAIEVMIKEKLKEKKENDNQIRL